MELDNIPLIAAITGNIICESNEYIRAILYAPEVTFLISIEQNMEIYGSVFAANLGTLENTTIVYPSEEESDLLGSIVLNILTWQASK